MGKGRLEAFSDGVIAIILTIMVLELKLPKGDSWVDVRLMIPGLLSYLLSYIYIGIYWNNHHHLFHTVQTVTGASMWANLHLLFWLSVVPFMTAWAAENHFSEWPVALYGFTLMMAGTAYYILSQALMNCHGDSSVLKRAVGKDLKGKISVAIYLVAIVAAFWQTAISCGLYVLVALMWVIPDRRIERVALQGPRK